MGEIEVSVVVETYTHSEGSELERLRAVLAAADEMVAAHGRGEVLVTDYGDQPDVTVLLEGSPRVRRVDVRGLDYDGAKQKAAASAHGDFVLFLDGDCLPAGGWLDGHLTPLRRGDAEATGGFTRYDGGYLAAVGTVLDFGFLLPRGKRALGCYASNNCGFKRALLTEVPIPAGPMRCRCFAHAQTLLRRGSPVTMVPEAAVRHEVQPFFRERYRQGYDAVAACWVDSTLREHSLLRLGPLAAPAFYARNVVLDWERVLRGRRDLSLSRLGAALALLLFPALRLVDLGGMLTALMLGPSESLAGTVAYSPPEKLRTS